MCLVLEVVTTIMVIFAMVFMCKDSFRRVVTMVKVIHIIIMATIATISTAMSEVVAKMSASIRHIIDSKIPG